MMHDTSTRTGAAKVPRHLAVIMDGNGRWAQQRGMMRVRGHQAGASAVTQIIENAARHGIKILTLYAFSSENWKRPAAEVTALMKLFHKALRDNTQKLHKNNIRVKVTGDVSALSPSLQQEIAALEELTCHNTMMQLNLAINYGSRPELTRMVQEIAKKAAAGEILPEAITPELIAKELWVPDDVDLLIRTGGEFRLSNFLLWQCAYAEIYVSPVLWPDFDEEELLKALDFYSGRERRFGRTSAQVQADKA